MICEKISPHRDDCGLEDDAVDDVSDDELDDEEDDDDDEEDDEDDADDDPDVLSAMDDVGDADPVKFSVDDKLL